MAIRFTKDSEPGAADRADYFFAEPGRTIADVCGTDQLRAWVNGREVPKLFMHRAHLKDGVEVFVEPIPKDPVTLSIAASITAAAAAVAPAAWAVGLAVASVGLSVAGPLYQPQR
ncbi:hypothetical protein [Salinisphaera sp. T31B1]|uniref:hypothetical protein n=1 Tax=Salinisphaera sp. T31B1 TaxID=727963 RepID=UPI00333E9D9B